jgi:DNA-binding ferritin-like protein
LGRSLSGQASQRTSNPAATSFLVASMRSLHDVCDEYSDVATASLLENWSDETEKRIWFLLEILRETNG